MKKMEFGAPMRSAEGPLARAPWSLPTRGPLGEPPAARSLRRDESPVLKSCVACTHAACSLQLLARTSGPSETGLFAQRRKQASCPPGPAPTHLSPLSSSWRPIRKKNLAISTQGWILSFSAELGLEGLTTRFLTAWASTFIIKINISPSSC